VKSKKTIIVLLLMASTTFCLAQTKIKMNNKNPLLCKPDSGICEVVSNELADKKTRKIISTTKPIRLIYFTDPICSSCWGIEPQIRKLKLEYGSSIDVEYKMGGLLPDWSYNSGGISKPSDVAHHWDEVSVYYDMPIDGDVWLEDPLHSSYPPSIAFKAAQMQDINKAVLFLREIREMVFLQKKNITKPEHLIAAVHKVGLDTSKFKSDFEGPAHQLFNDDLKLAKQLGVRGFPTIFFADSAGNNEMVYGAKPYTDYQTALMKLYPEIEKESFDKSLDTVFSKYHSLTANEYALITNTPRTEAENTLNNYTRSGVLKKIITKNGDLWMFEK